jgi:hypothetical protein
VSVDQFLVASLRCGFQRGGPERNKGNRKGRRLTALSSTNTLASA